MADSPELHVPPDPGDALTQEEPGAEGIREEDVQQATQLPGGGVSSSLAEGDSVAATNQVSQEEIVDGGDGAVGMIGDSEVHEGEDAASVEPLTVKNGKYNRNVFILELLICRRGKRAEPAGSMY